MKPSARTIYCALLIVLLSGCGQHPQIDVVPQIEHGKVVFNLPHTNMNGLLGFAVIEGTNTIWEISTSYEEGAKIVYGELPTGGNMTAKQVVPPPGIVPAPISGRLVTVRVNYQFDAGFAAQVGHFEKLMQMPAPESATATNRFRSPVESQH